MFTEVGLLDDFLQVVEARLVVGQRPQMCSLPLSQREMNSKTTHGVECVMRVAITHPAHEGPQSQPERDGWVRCGALAVIVSIKLIQSLSQFAMHEIVEKCRVV